MSSSTAKLKPLGRLVSLLKRERKKGRKIVFTNGCFDILHVGHVRYLRKARSLGDFLVIGLNSDASVRRLKGAERPVTREKDRAEVLGALSCVDHLVLFADPTPERLIRAIRPDFLVKGGDWRKKDIVGSGFVESYGGKVRSLPYIRGFSTTGLLEKIKRL
jgi:D-beta-D-heptose 7-phosphate kinase/D-beta-D-heptose 1-phosphate adenosyltransferase